jgi:Uma2 family endonuclease
MIFPDVLEPEATAPTVSDDALYEVVDDRRVELPPMAAYSNWIAFNLASEIEQFAKTRKLGRAITENLFRLQSQPNLQRRPDAAYVSFERWARGRRIPSVNAWDVIPDLVVEVISPTNLAEEIPTKVREYFEAGVRRALVIFPHESLVYDYDSPRSIRVMGLEDSLEGGEILPGFRLALAELFEGIEEPDPS